MQTQLKEIKFRVDEWSQLQGPGREHAALQHKSRVSTPTDLIFIHTINTKLLLYLESRLPEFELSLIRVRLNFTFCYINPRIHCWCKPRPHPRLTGIIALFISNNNK